MIIFGVICIGCAFASMSIMPFSPVGILAPVFWAAVASVLIAKGMDNQKRRAEEKAVSVNAYHAAPAASSPAPRPAPVRSSRAASASVVASRTFRVAGVTFRNDDGTSRQKILKDLCDGDDFGTAEAWLEWYKYKGEDAFHVMTAEGCVGNLHREDIRPAVIAIGADTVELDIETFEKDEGGTIYRADLVVYEKI